MLTDGTNGIPVDHPTRVVREDPERQAGLLYAGTEFGIFVSFDNGALAAAAAEPAGDAGHRHPGASRRSRHRDDGAVVLDHGRHHAAAADGGGRQPADAAPAVLAHPLSPRRRRAGRRAAISAGRARDRLHRARGLLGSADVDDRDAQGRVVRTVDTTAAGRRGQARGAVRPTHRRWIRTWRRRAAAGGRGAPLTTRAGHNRYMWDYRWSNNGPLVAPGKYVASLAVPPAGVGTPQSSSEFEVQVDPACARWRDGGGSRRAADLPAPRARRDRGRDSAADATQQAMEKADIQPARSPGPGQSINSIELQPSAAAHLGAPGDGAGIYEQGMLIDQLGNIARAEGGRRSEGRRRVAAGAGRTAGGEESGGGGEEEGGEKKGGGSGGRGGRETGGARGGRGGGGNGGDGGRSPPPPARLGRWGGRAKRGATRGGGRGEAREFCVVAGGARGKPCSFSLTARCQPCELLVHHVAPARH